MKAEFKIYKDGITSEPITILSKNGVPFNRKLKIKKYLALGYKIYDMDGKEILK